MLDSDYIVNCIKTKLKKGIPATKEQIETSILFQIGMAISQSRRRIGLITDWLSELDETLSVMLEDGDTDALWHTSCADNICQTQLLIHGLFEALAEIDFCQRIYQSTQKDGTSSDDDE